MGYTTIFTGAIALSRPLSFSEAKQLLEYSDEPDNIPLPHPESYLQWVPSETLDHIVWDGGEKFYNYVEWMKWLCAWLASIGITASGAVHWSGEDASDQGEILVLDSEVMEKTKQIGGNKRKPLSLSGLERMALEQAIGREVK